MPTRFQKKIAIELARVKEIIKQFPGGANIDEINQAAGLDLELRTLQRRLASLIDKKELELIGSKRTARYWLVEKNRATLPVTKHTSAASDQIVPLSAASREILTILSPAFDRRKPVTYNRAFVDRYEPNSNFYLSEKERNYLKQLTTTPGGEVQPAGTYAKYILQRLLIDLSWNSSRLEGNTYSLLETERLLSHGEPASGKSAEESQMILNHKEAIEFLVAGTGEIGFNRYTILNLHAILANNLLPDPAAPGRLRSYPVGIRKSVYTPPEIPQLVEEMFDLILAKTAMINNPHEQALFAMIQLPYLQPFEDVNKRVSRLAANIPLNQHNLIPISFIGVPEDLYIQGLLGVYELNRIDLLKDIFLWACARSADRYTLVRQTIGEPNPFRIKYRLELQQVVSHIVSQAMTHEEADLFIKARALQVPDEDRVRFKELIETELLNLHEGNFARYRVTPSEYKIWVDAWAK